MRGETAAASALFPEVIVKDQCRSIRAGIDPGGKPKLRPDPAGLDIRQQRSLLYNEFWPEIHDTLLRVDGENRMAAVVDADGYVLEQKGLRKLVRVVNQFGQVIGGCWIDLEASTNAIRMAHLLKQSIQVPGFHHFRVDQQTVVCTASAVFGPKRRIEGYIDLVAPLEEINPEMLTLVDELAERIGARIELRHRERWERMADWVEQTLRHEPRSEPFVVICGDGSVVHAHRWDWDRVVVPAHGLRLGRHELDGVIVEPLYNGWVVRRMSATDRPRVKVELDFRPDRDRKSVAQLHVRGRTAWSQRLTLGNAELLLAVADRQRTYSELAEWLYETPQETSRSTRVRWCRLRMDVGSLLAGADNERGFASGVDVEVLDPEDPRDLLPGSTAPGVVERRARLTRGIG